MKVETVQSSNIQFHKGNATVSKQSNITIQEHGERRDQEVENVPPTKDTPSEPEHKPQKESEKQPS